jgi:hypothetical protein
MVDDYDEIMSMIGGILALQPDEMQPLPAVIDMASIRADRPVTARLR